MTLTIDSLPLLIGGMIVVFWLWALLDCLTRDFRGNDKIVWALILVLLGPIGALIYLIVGRAQGTKRSA